MHLFLCSVYKNPFLSLYRHHLLYTRTRLIFYAFVLVFLTVHTSSFFYIQYFSIQFLFIIVSLSHIFHLLLFVLPFRLYFYFLDYKQSFITMLYHSTLYGTNTPTSKQSKNQNEWKFTAAEPYVHPTHDHCQEHTKVVGGKYISLCK